MNILRINKVLLLLLFAFNFLNAQNEELVKSNFTIAQKQYSEMLQKIDNSELSPRSINKDGSLKLVKSKDWTSGFFPGCLWYMYEFTKDNKWKNSAEFFTNNVENEQYNGGTHDMGFKMFCSYGNGYRLKDDEHYKKVLLQSAKTLSTRFNPKIGCIRSWDHNKDKWQYPVIIDNMMNLELLFWAAEESGDSSFYNIAVSHANATLKNHFRDDFSSWHVVNYDTATGKVISKGTHQGYSDSSCWARGEAWALYGYTMCYRYTQDKKYLNQAEHISEYILTNKNLPDDMIPYWDYNAPNIPNEERDASAAAIMCSALYELNNYSDSNGGEYLQAADKILTSLSSPKYLSAVGDNKNFILKHSVGSKPADSEVDVPIIYADYYFLEANLRKAKIASLNQVKVDSVKKLITALDKERVVNDANEYLKEEPITITSFKADRSAGGIHDFYSEGDYWWVDPQNPEGPYIRKDGLTNPDNFVAHRQAMRRLSIQVPALVAAYKFTGDKKYAEHAVKHLLAWFVNKQTMMNPNLNYSQAIKGRFEGRGIGIIDAIHLVEVVQAAMVLEKNIFIKKDDLNKIKNWFTEFSDWLMNSQFGIDERDNGNNHSACWNMQVAEYAKFIGDEKKLEFCRNHFEQTLLPEQLAADGSFPKELARTKPYGYSLFNLDAMTMVAKILSTPENNLWQYETKDSVTLEAAIEFMYPFIKDKSKWQYQKDVMYFDDWPVRQPSLLFGGIAYDTEKYIDLWKTLNPAPTKEEILRNFFIRQPILWID